MKKNWEILRTNEKTLKFDYNFNVFYLMQLIARNYFKNYGAIFSDYLLPIIIMSVLFNVLDKDAVRTMLPGIIIAPLISSGFISFAMGFFQWKNSIIFKKIKISRISTSQFFLSFFLFYFFACLLSFVSNFLFTIILKLIGIDTLKYFFQDLELVNWATAIPAIFLLIILTIASGIILAFLVTNFNAIIGFGLTIFLVSCFLLGCYLSLSMVVEKQYMYKISWFIPYYAPIRIFQLSWLEKIELPLNYSNEIPVLENKVGKMVILRNLNLNLDWDNEKTRKIIEQMLYQSNIDNQLTTNSLLFPSEFKPIIDKLESGEWKIANVQSLDLKIIKDFKILSFEIDFWKPNLAKYNSVHFHKSYWSVFLLGFGWIAIFAGIINFLYFYKKE